MHAGEQLLLIGGALTILSVLAGLVSDRYGAPILLVFLGLGMLAGQDGPGGIAFDDFQASFVIGSIALAVILFEGGLKTERAMVRAALWPALALATVGVALTAGLVGLAVRLAGASWIDAMLVGGAMAPTDAAAVAAVLRRARIVVPVRVMAALEIESGLNDPMAVFVILVLEGVLVSGAPVSLGTAAVMFAWQMGGGAALGLAAGYAMRALLRALPSRATLHPVLALAGALSLFGGSQLLGTSGFLAVYLMGAMLATRLGAGGDELDSFIATLALLAQIVLFLMLGLLVTPHALLPVLLPGVATAVVLIFVARPVATAICLRPFGYSWRETGFVAWVGLRGAVPIYLTMIPVLEGHRTGILLFGAAFVIVVISLAVQGWTIWPAARLLGFGRPAEEDGPAH